MLSYEDKSNRHIILYISRTLILIFFLLLYKISFIKKNKNKNIKRDLSNINGNYSLYKYFKYPQISIIIPDIDVLILDNNILELIKNLRIQTLKNIEIILTFAKTEFKEYKELEKICLSDKRIKLKKNQKKKLINNLFSLMEILILYIFKFTRLFYIN